MTKSKKYGLEKRRQGALDRLITQKEKLIKEEQKVPKRIKYEIETLKKRIYG
jgi:hypothetical protein